MSLPKNALEIFAHAGKHGHKTLLTKAAPYLVGTPLDKVVSELPEHLIVPWVCSFSLQFPPVSFEPVLNRSDIMLLGKNSSKRPGRTLTRMVFPGFSIILVMLVQL